MVQIQPTVLIHKLIDGEYQVMLFRGCDRIVSSALPELELTAIQIFQAGAVSFTYSLICGVGSFDSSDRNQYRNQ